MRTKRWETLRQMRDKPMVSKITVQTAKKREIVDISDMVEGAIVPGSRYVHVVVLHTTAAVTTADLDPGTDEDFLDFLEAITPARTWRHPHDPSHAPDHLLASMIGPSVTIPVLDDALTLGTWQRIVLVELDGPRERSVAIMCS